MTQLILPVEMALVDMDGVVADIHTPLCDVHGFDVNAWKLGEYWFEKAFGVSTDQVFAHPRLQTVEFWAEAPKTAFADELMELLLNKYGRDHICFLSKPRPEDVCLRGKNAWLDKHYPKIHRLIGSTKKFCAGPGRTLLDDYDVNVDEFTAHGGRGVVVPRRWNRNHNEETMVYLRRMI